LLATASSSSLALVLWLLRLLLSLLAGATLQVAQLRR